MDSPSPSIDSPLGRSCQLYASSKISQILNSCVDVAFEKGSSLEPSDFAPYDVLHYLGVEEMTRFLNNHVFPNKISDDVSFLRTLSPIFRVSFKSLQSFPFTPIRGSF